MRSLVTEAIVLKAAPFGESDRIVALFTREAGLVSAMAKGAGRSRKRFGGALNSLSKIQATIQWRKSNAMPLLSAASLVDFGLGLRTDLQRVAQAFYMSELLWRGTKPGVRMMELYDSFAMSLARLAATGPNPADLAGFLLAYQTAHGYRPRLDDCSLCKASIETSGPRPSPPAAYPYDLPISFKSGGVVCYRCVDRSEINMRLPLGALAWLQSVSHSSLDSPRLAPRPSPLIPTEPALQFLHRFTVYHLEFQPASWRWWRRVLGEADEASGAGVEGGQVKRVPLSSTNDERGTARYDHEA